MTILSVIVPVYNQAKYLDNALQSVMNQTIKEWECIVINDGSIDESHSVVSRYLDQDPRFVYIYQENRGVSIARNHGMEMARGDYVLFLDADDSIHTRMSELLIGVLEQEESVGVAYGGYDLIDDRGNLIRSVRAPVCRGDRYVERLLVSNLFPPNAAIVRKATLEKIGIEFPDDERPEDWVFWLRLALEGAHFRSVEDVVCCHRKQYLGRSSHVMEKTLGAERFLKKAIREASDRHGISKRFEYVVLAALYLRRYLDAVEFEDDEARSYCKARLSKLNRLRLIGLSRYHLYILGLYLDIHEATNEYHLMEPIVLGRRLARNLIDRFH